MSVPRRPFARPAVSLLTAVVLGSGLLAGCSGDDSASEADASAEASSESADEASESESPSASPSESDSEAADGSDSETTGASEGDEVDVPLPKAPKARNTPEGRKAFTEFVVERWGYALNTNKAAALSDLSAKGSTCRGCKELAQELAKRRKQGWAVEFPGATVDKITVKGAGAPATFESTAVIDIPVSRSYFDDGTYRNENEAFKNAKFIVGMRFTKARYVLLSYRVA